MTVAFHFIIGINIPVIFQRFRTDVLFTPDLNRTGGLITVCIPRPPNVMSTAAALLGAKGRAE